LFCTSAKRKREEEREKKRENNVVTKKKDYNNYLKYKCKRITNFIFLLYYENKVLFNKIELLIQFYFM